MRRVNYLIKKDFQLDVVFKFLVIALVNNAILYSAFYLFFKNFSKEALEMGIPKQHVFFLFIDQVQNDFNIFFFAALLTCTLFITISGIYISHKIAGPLYKIEKHMQECVESGDLSEINFRKGDYFNELEINYNKLIHSIKNKN